jgi:putative sterol carrier protein
MPLPIAMVQYFTRPYFEELANLLNNDKEFQAKASNLSVTLLNVAKDKNVSFLLKVDKGKVSVQDGTPETAADFTFIGDYATWITNHKDGATLEKLIMTGKIKFKGSIPRIMSLKGQLGAVDQKARTIAVEY